MGVRIPPGPPLDIPLKRHYNGFIEDKHGNMTMKFSGQTFNRISIEKNVDFKVGDIVLETTGNGDLDARSLGRVEEVFDKTLTVRPKHPLFSRLFIDGTYSALKENTVKADPRLIYYVLELESKQCQGIDG